MSLDDVMIVIIMKDMVGRLDAKALFFFSKDIMEYALGLSKSKGGDSNIYYVAYNQIILSYLIHLH